MIMTMISIILGALLNRGRGSQFWGRCPSTTLSRLVFSYGMGMLASFTTLPDFRLFMEVLLCVTIGSYVWSVKGWDALWSLAIGTGTTGKLLERLEGVGVLAYRHAIGIAPLVICAWLTGHPSLWVLLPLTFGIPYFISGYVTPGKYVIRNAELAVGGMLAFCYYAISL